MSRTVVAEAVAAASRVRDAGHLGAFRHAVEEFVEVLGAVPDESAGALPAEAARTLQTIGQDVIDLIEERVADIASARDAQELVSSIYEIRRLLEETGRLRQHYATARHV